MRKTKGMRVFGAFNGIILIVLALTCLLPFIHILALSFSSSAMVMANRVGLWPQDFTLNAYKFLIGKSQFWRAMTVTLERIALGGGLNMFFIIVLAYPLSRDKRNFRMRGVYVWFFFFTSLFGGGLIPSYMLLNKLKMLDTIWSITLPCAVPVFNVILMLNFYRQLPHEMEEAAYIDGAGHFRTLFVICVPCSLPAIATLTLFTIVGHWNSWFDGLIYMNNARNYPLMSYVQTIVVGLDFTSMSSVDFNSYEMMSSLSDRTLRAAQIIISIVPILMVYPFLSKYFISGIVLGSVKG